jgi:hypothetical protein
MGYAVSFLGFRGIEAEQVHTLLNLKASPGNSSFLNAPITAAVLPTGWYVIFFNNKAFREFKNGVLAELSNAGELCYGFLEDHVMCSAISMWVDGHEAWSVAHDGQHGRHHMDASGALPREFDAIRERQFAFQEAEPRADVDHLIEIPMDLGRLILGFTREHGVDGNPEFQFAVLEQAKKKWFGMF